MRILYHSKCSNNCKYNIFWYANRFDLLKIKSNLALISVTMFE